MVRTRLLSCTAAIAVAAVCAAALVACSSDAGGDSAKKLTLMTHDSFATTKGIFDDFTKETGIKVEVIQGGDAGAMLNQAILTKDDPAADVIYGVDNTFLSRALDEDLFVPHEAAGLDAVAPEFQLDAEHRVTPIDYGDVCVNYDKAWFAAHNEAPPTTIAELTDPKYRGQLVVENPATSSPGLAFLAATTAGVPGGWQQWWQQLRANDVLVSDGWEQAYNTEFSAGPGNGKRPLVVSYATSPAAEVAFADPPRDDAPTGVVTDGCFRQIEFAGVVKDTKDEKGAGRLVDYMLAKKFQEDMPLNMFVFPVNPDAALPPVFTAHAATVASPADVGWEEIGANRDKWVKEWTSIVLR